MTYIQYRNFSLPVKLLHLKFSLFFTKMILQSSFSTYSLTTMRYSQFFFFFLFSSKIIIESLTNNSILTLQAPTLQNGQTHSSNSSGNCRRIVWVCLTILWGWHSKGYKYKAALASYISWMCYTRYCRVNQWH